MLYKTICLHLIQEHPQMYDQLLSNRTLLPTLNHLAIELKTRHEAWTEQLYQTRPGSDPSQMASEAAEMALKELADRLPAESPPDENEAFSLDDAMAFLNRPSPPA